MAEDTKNNDAINDQENVAKWIRYLTGKISPVYLEVNTLRILRLYALRTDSYINSALRNRTYPLQKLIGHFSEYVKDGAEWNFGYTNEVIVSKYKEIITKCKQLKHPLNIFHNYNMELAPKAEYISFDYFLATVRQIIFEMYNVMNIIAIKVDKPDMIVYRGINVPKNTKIKLELEGLSSTSTSIYGAIQFSASTYGAEEYVIMDTSDKDFYVFDIRIHEGTRIVPMDVCTIQEENEIVIVSQGKLIETDRIEETIDYWNDLYDGKKLTRKLDYTRIVCDLKITEDYPSLGLFVLDPKSNKSNFEKYLKF